MLAALVPPCVPDPSAGSYLADKDRRSDAREWEQKRCRAVNDVLALWEPRLAKLEALRQRIDEAAHRENWRAAKTAWEEAEPLLDELKTAAVGHPKALNADNLIALFSATTGYLFQNVGLPAPSSFPDARAKLETALESKARLNRSTATARITHARPMTSR